MSRTPSVRLSPQAAGQLQQQCECVSKRLRELARYHEEFDCQLTQLIGPEALNHLHHATENALLLSDLIKEKAA